MTDDGSQASGHGAPISSNSELRGQRGEACRTSSLSTWTYAPASPYPASLTPQYERLVRAISELVAEKTRGFDFLWGTLKNTSDNVSGTFHNAANIGPSLAMLFGAFEVGKFVFVSGSIDSSDHCKLFAF